MPICKNKCQFEKQMLFWKNKYCLEKINLISKNKCQFDQINLGWPFLASIVYIYS